MRRSWNPKFEERNGLHGSEAGMLGRFLDAFWLPSLLASQHFGLLLGFRYSSGVTDVVRLGFAWEKNAGKGGIGRWKNSTSFPSGMF
jgi:hypothetical protein